MKRQPYLANPRLLAIGLTLTVILASCIPLEQNTVLPVATGIPTQNSRLPEVMPEIILLPNKLVCPNIPRTEVLLPSAPYDEELGDCALIGRSGEIEAWLTELEQIAASCQAKRETNWADTLAARDNLNYQIDELQVVDPFQNPFEMSWMELSCPTYININIQGQNIESPSLSDYYTGLLKFIGENVERYCSLIDELVKPLWQACDEINFYQDCQAPNLEQYHSIIEGNMNAAQFNYDYTDFFYTNILQIIDWDIFSANFNPADLDCPPIQPLASSPTFTFSKNAFCRKGPSTLYEDVTAFPQNQSVEIDGRNQDEPRWWWVLIPGSSGHCWVSDSTGSSAGSLEGVNTLAAPPLPQKLSPTATPNK